MPIPAAAACAPSGAGCSQLGAEGVFATFAKALASIFKGVIAHVLGNQRRLLVIAFRADLDSQRKVLTQRLTMRVVLNPCGKPRGWLSRPPALREDALDFTRQIPEPILSPGAKDDLAVVAA